MASRRGRGRRQRVNVKEEAPTDSILQDVVRRVDASPIANPSGDHSDLTILTGKGSKKEDTGQDDVDRNSGPVSARMEEKPRASPDASDPHQVCVVCGDKASGQYFGAIVCLPCKSFYIRCTKDGDPFFSTRCLGNCDVTKQARIRCQSCRFQKCLNAGMSRREKPERVDPEEGQYLCLVCGDLANGIHFGVFTCEGCKKFFRRGLVENKTYNCKGDSSCVINPRSRNTCRACRYRKCIEVGMSREAIKMGRPKKKDGDIPRRAKTSTSRPSLSTDETLDVILVHSNDSDSDEDVKLLEVPVDISDQAQPTPEENKLLPSTEHSQSVSSSHSSVQSPPLSTQGSPGKSWSPYPLHQMTKSTKETQPFKSLPPDDSPRPTPSTVTSGSEYNSYDDRRLSARTVEKYIGKHGPEKSLIPEVNETALQPVSTESPVTSDRTSSTDSEISAIYSMSSDEIDSMLRLLEDFERPKVSSSCRRRTSRDAIEDDNQGKRKRLADETDDKCREVLPGFRYCSHYDEAEGPRHSEYHSSLKQGIQTAWNRPMKIESSDSKGRDGSALHAEYSTTTYDITQGDITKATRVIQTSSVDSYVSHTGLPMFHPNTPCKVVSDENDRQCNCRCWTKQPNTVQIQTSENWKESRGSFNEWTSKGSNSTSTSMKTYNMKVLDQQLDRPSFGEISKAFEVLYDKLGYSNAIDEFCTVEKRKQSISSVESWWDIDVDCRCIKVTGGLCLCKGGPTGQMTDEAPEEKYLASVPPPIARICTTLVREPCSPYLPRKYRCQEFLEPSPITDVQQQVLHQLLESCLMSIADTTEGAGKEENCTATEIPTLLRA